MWPMIRAKKVTQRDYSEYEWHIDRYGGRPLRAKVGVPLIVLALLGLFALREYVDDESVRGSAGLAWLALSLYAPYYFLKLTIRKRMTEHLAAAKRARVAPFYMPNPRLCAAAYVGWFFLVVGPFVLFSDPSP